MSKREKCSYPDCDQPALIYCSIQSCRKPLCKDHSYQLGRRYVCAQCWHKEKRKGLIKQFSIIGIMIAILVIAILLKK